VYLSAEAVIALSFGCGGAATYLFKIVLLFYHQRHAGENRSLVLIFFQLNFNAVILDLAADIEPQSDQFDKLPWWIAVPEAAPETSLTDLHSCRWVSTAVFTNLKFLEDGMREDSRCLTVPQRAHLALDMHYRLLAQNLNGKN
jgi:hypothetical protein